jgi:hypothetical protein
MKTDRRNFIKAAGMAGTGMVAGGMVLLDFPHFFHMGSNPGNKDS